jgi:hypothetical protein
MNIDILSDWQKWKKTLSSMVGVGQKLGMEDDTIDNVAFRISDFLADKINPKNPQERLLQELWKVGNEDEKKALTKMVIKMVNNADNPEEQSETKDDNNKKN